MTTTATNYLAIDPGYSARLGGLRWSYSLDSIEFDDGITFTVNPELRLLLEGAAHGRALPPFAYLLTLFHRMKRVETDPLYRAFQSVKGDIASTRNAGALIAELCRTLPGLSIRPSILDLSLMLETGFPVEGHHFGVRGEKSPLSFDEFIERIAPVLASFDDDELRHWLRHGQERPRHVGRLADATEAIDERLRQLLASWKTNERLVGALTLSPTMDSALTLPPRRRTRDAPPQGGYQDVTTRGDPERLLPSQFALDSDEFIRRFAGNELLYFEREVPHAPRLPERILILDQGVRTWGGVRLALASGLMTLLKRDPRSFGALQLYLTSTPDLVSLTEGSTGELTRHLEASDLTAHPANRVKRVVESSDDPETPRDLILLTHPRNLQEGELLKTLDSLHRIDRFFALCVDDAGEAELLEWQRTGFVSLRKFRVDLAAAQKAKPEAVGVQVNVFQSSGWTGDVEPIPFPFHVGLIDEITHVNFDGTSSRLVMVSRRGIPHALDLSTSRIEVLPRALHRGTVLKQIQAILPTNDGVVLVGIANCIVGEGEPIDLYVAAHYDFANRTAKTYEFGSAVPHQGWYSYPDLHCIVLHVVHSTVSMGVATDLSTGERFMSGLSRDLPNARLFHACNRQGEGQAVYSLPVVPLRPVTSITGKGPYLRQAGTHIEILRWEGGHVDFEPMVDGKPLLEGATIWQARLSGNLLAVNRIKGDENQIYLFRLPSGRILREFPWTNETGAFTLSPSRTRLVLHRGRWEIRVLSVPDASEPPVEVSRGHLHDKLDLILVTDPFVFHLSIGKWTHRFTCPDGQLKHTLDWNYSPPSSNPEAVPRGPLLLYDRDRFSSTKLATASRLQAVMDHLGQVLLLDSAGRIVAIFLVRRGRAAAWLPSGVFWGDPLLSGTTAHPDAATLVSEAIVRALGSQD